MYRINLDVIKKIIYIDISGNMSKEEIKAYIFDLTNLLNKFDHKTFDILVSAQRLDPLSQMNIPIFQEVIETGLIWAKTIAVVVGNRTTTRMQLKRIESEVQKSLISDTSIKHFKTLNEAMNYLKI